MSLSGPNDLPASAAEAVDVLLVRAGLGMPGGSGPAAHGVNEEEIPEPYRSLLVQPGFMSETFARRHGKAVELHLMNVGWRDSTYSRKVFFTAVSDDTALEYGLATVHTEHLPGELVERLRQGVHPLGRLLVRDGMPHQVQPRWFFRLDRGAPLLKWYAARRPGSVYGRISSVLCAGRPAAELLEIVTGDAPARLAQAAGNVHGRTNDTETG